MSKQATESETGTYGDQVRQLAENLSAVSPTPVPEILPPSETPSAPLPASPANDKLERLINRLQRHNKGEAPHQAAPAVLARGRHGSRIVTGLKCPRCNKRALRKAKRVTFLDRIVALAMLSPYHCRYCQYSEWRFMIEAVENSANRY